MESVVRVFTLFFFPLKASEANMTKYQYLLNFGGSNIGVCFSALNSLFKVFIIMAIIVISTV